MASWIRIGIAFWVSVGCAIAGIIHYRVGVEYLYPLAINDFPGPMSSSVETLQYMVPAVLSIIILGMFAWALAGGVQEEKSRVRRGRR